jgi:pimeloyl-ACP methyl ester carboxylesterase
LADQIIFLPGAGGMADFWEPVAELLDIPLKQVFIGWPGFGDAPHDPSVSKLTDLVDFVFKQVQQPMHIIAQSMGGVVALLMALEQPDLIEKLVLAGTSGGMDMTQFNAEDWRPDFTKEMPEATPSWFVDDRTDISSSLGSIQAPTLLMRGGDDAISPPGAMEYLSRMIPDTQLCVIPQAGHLMPREQPAEVAATIRAFLV